MRSWPRPAAAPRDDRGRLPDRPAGRAGGLRAAVVTGDLDQARELLAAADFFGTVFAAAPADRAAPAPADLVELHRRSAAAVAAEIRQRSR